MIRAVVDTSVLIRYLIKPGAATKELIEERWLNDEVQMVTAPELVRELEEVLGRERIRAYIRPVEGQTLLDAIHLKADMLPALGSVPSFTRDPKDDKFVACALMGNASFIISEDRDILALGTVEGVRALTPYHFIRELDRDR